jgi:hypothetical protein
MFHWCTPPPCATQIRAHAIITKYRIFVVVRYSVDENFSCAYKNDYGKACFQIRKRACVPEDCSLQSGTSTLRMIRSDVYIRRKRNMPDITVKMEAEAKNQSWSAELVVYTGLTPGGGAMAGPSNGFLAAVGTGPAALEGSDMFMRFFETVRWFVDRKVKPNKKGSKNKARCSRRT